MLSPLRHRASRGLTLFELLLVICILAILVALVFPLTRQIREQSIKAKCLSNLRAVGTALLSVSVERNGRLPALGHSWASQSPTWGMVTAEKMGINLNARAQKTAFWCPVDRSVETEGGLWMHENHVGHSSYAANVNLMDWEEGFSTLAGDPRGGARLSEITSPGRTILLMENHRPNNVISWADQGGKTYQPGWTYEYTIAGQDTENDPGKRGYHNSANHWFFADGHIEMLSFQNTISPQNLWLK